MTCPDGVIKCGLDYNCIRVLIGVYRFSQNGRPQFLENLCELRVASRNALDVAVLTVIVTSTYHRPHYIFFTNLDGKSQNQFSTFSNKSLCEIGKMA